MSPSWGTDGVHGAGTYRLPTRGAVNYVYQVAAQPHLFGFPSYPPQLSGLSTPRDDGAAKDAYDELEPLS